MDTHTQIKLAADLTPGETLLTDNHATGRFDAATVSSVSSHEAAGRAWVFVRTANGKCRAFESHQHTYHQPAA